MIIEVFLSHPDSETEEYTQTYVINGNNGYDKSVYNIKSYLYSAQVMELLGETMFLFGITLNDNDLEPITEEEMNGLENHFSFKPGSRIAITDCGNRLDITFLSNGRIQMVINHNDLYNGDLNGNFMIVENMYMPFSAIMKIKKLTELVEDFRSIIIINMTNGHIMGTKKAMADADEYTEAYYDMPISKVIQLASTPGREDSFDVFLEAVLATHPILCFSDCYTSVEQLFEKEEVPEDEVEDYSSESEIEMLQNRFEEACETLRAKEESPNEYHIINADPYYDDFSIPSKNDGFHEAMKEIMEDPDARNFIKDCMHEIIDQIFDSEKENPVSRLYEKPDGSGSMMICQGYVDENGKLHVIKPDGEDQIVN